MQRVRRIFRHSHATLQVVARDFLASHRSDNRCAGVRLAQCFIFEVSMKERVTTPPNKPERANRRQLNQGFREPVGEACVRSLTAAVAHPGR